jgi:hypothetical protein
MTRAHRFSMVLASALLVTSMAPAASAAEPLRPAPASDLGQEPRTHLVSGSFGLTPAYMGTAGGHHGTGGSDAYADAGSALLFGASGDYLYSFGVVRLGVGLRYSHAWEFSEGSSTSFAHELGTSALVSFGGTTKAGVDIAVTAGVGIGRAWMPHFDLFSSNWGGVAELLFSVAVPVERDMDLYARAGLNVGVFSEGNIIEDGPLPYPDAYLLRAYMPHEIGLRKRF